MTNQTKTNNNGREGKIKEGIWNILDDIVEGMDVISNDRMIYRETVRYLHLKHLAEFYFNQQEMREFIRKYHNATDEIELRVRMLK